MEMCFGERRDASLSNFKIYPKMSSTAFRNASLWFDIFNPLCLCPMELTGFDKE